MNVAIAFGAGILSFLSPCVLPLVPAFLVDMAGEAALAGAQRARTFVHGLAFVLHAHAFGKALTEGDQVVERNAVEQFVEQAQNSSKTVPAKAPPIFAIE